jgi:LacI family transcriptional regulator
VSRVFNDHPDVSAETRDRVMRVAKKLNYRPFGCARQLVRNVSETICFLISNRDVINPFHPHILAGVEQYARAQAHKVVFMRVDYDPSAPQTTLCCRASFGNADRSTG